MSSTAVVPDLVGQYESSKVSTTSAPDLVAEYEKQKAAPATAAAPAAFASWTPEQRARRDANIAAYSAKPQTAPLQQAINTQAPGMPTLQAPGVALPQEHTNRVLKDFGIKIDPANLSAHDEQADSSNTGNLALEQMQEGRKQLATIGGDLGARAGGKAVDLLNDNQRSFNAPELGAKTKGVVKGVGRFGGSMAADPFTYMTAGLGTGTKATRTVMGLGFAAQMAAGSVDTSKQLGEIWDRSDIPREQKIELGTDAVLSAVMAGVSGAHGVRAPFKPEHPYFSNIPEEDRAAVAERVNQKINYDPTLPTEEQTGRPQLALPPAPPSVVAEHLATMSRANQNQKMGARVARGMPAVEPQTPAPTPGELLGNKMSGKDVEDISSAIASAPEDKRNDLIEQAHTKLTQWIADNKGKVIIDGKIHMSKTPEQAETLAAKLVNDAVSAHDKKQAKPSTTEDTKEHRGNPAQVEATASAKPAPEVQQFIEQSKPVTMGKGITQDSPAVQAVAEQAQTAAGQVPEVGVKKETAANAAQLAKPAEPVTPEDINKVGAEDEKSGRQVLQPSESELQNERLAQDAAPTLTTDLSQLSAQIEGAKFARLRPQKNLDRLDEKQDAGKPPETIADYLAAQISAETPEAKEQILQALQQKYKVLSVEDKFMEGDPELAGYASVKVQVQLPNGLSSEIQIVPRDVQDITEQSHGHYTDARKAEQRGDLVAAYESQAKAEKLNTEALNRFKTRNGIANGRPNANSPVQVAPTALGDSTVVHRGVGSPVGHGEVLDTVVGADTVPVVNDFGGQQGSSETALHNQSVLENSPAIDAKSNVSTVQEPLASAIDATRLRAESSPSAASPAGVNGELSNAELTNARNLVPQLRSGSSSADLTGSSGGTGAGAEASMASISTGREVGTAGLASEHAARSISMPTVERRQKPRGLDDTSRIAEYRRELLAEKDPAMRGELENAIEREAAIARGEQPPAGPEHQDLPDLVAMHEQERARTIDNVSREREDSTHGSDQAIVASEPGGKDAAAGIEQRTNGAAAAGGAKGKALADQPSNVVEFKPRQQVYKTTTQGEVRGRVLDFKRKEPAPRRSADNSFDSVGSFDEAVKLEASDPKAAITIYDQIIEHGQDDKMTLSSLVNRGTLFYNERKYSQAIESYLKAVHLDPHYALAQFNLANALEESGGHAGREEAVIRYEQAIKDAPSWADPYYNLGRVQHQLHNNAKALEAYRSFLKLESTGEFAHFARTAIKQLTDHLAVIQGKGKGDKQPTGKLEIAKFDEAIKHTGAEVKEGPPPSDFAAKIAKGTHLEPPDIGALEQFKGAAHQREYFTSALQAVKDAYIEKINDAGGRTDAWDSFMSKRMKDYKEQDAPEGYKTAQLYIKVPGDGHFLVNNTPFAIERALKGAREGFTPPKQRESKLTVPRSPKEFDNEKYIVGLEKELADLRDRRSGSYEKEHSFIDEQIKAAEENLAEAKKLKSGAAPSEDKPLSNTTELTKGTPVNLNGRLGTVQYLHPEMNIARVKFSDGKTETVNVRDLRDRSGEHGFARMDVLAAPVAAAKDSISSFLDKRKERQYFTGQARELEQGLAGLDRKYEAAVLDTREMLKKVNAAFTPEQQEAVYHAVEAEGKGTQPGAAVPHGSLSPAEQTLKSQFVDPIKKINQDLHEELTGMGWGDLFPEQGYIHRVVQGKSSRLDIASHGQQGGKGSILSKSAGSTKERKMFALEDEDGTRIVVHKADGKVTAFDNGRTVQMGEYEGGLKPGGKFTDSDGQTWKLTQATTKEIEGATSLKYFKNAMAVTALDNLELQRAVNAARFLEDFKSRPEFSSVAVKADSGEPIPAGWKQTDVPQFKGYHFEPRTREVLDELYDKLGPKDEPGRLAEFIGKINDVIQTSVLLNPLMHIGNIGDIYVTERGLAKNAQIWKGDQAIKAVSRGLRDVIERNENYIKALREGAPLMSHRLLVRDINNTFQDVLTGAAKDSDFRAKLSEALALPKGMNPLEYVRGTSHAMAFMTNDAFLLGSVYEKVDAGMTFDAALHQTMRVFPEYRVPTRVADMKWLADVMKSRMLSWFSGYHYGRWRAFRNMAADSIRPEVKGDRGMAISRVAMLGMMLAVVYPAVQEVVKKLSGDPNARVKRFGLTSSLQNIVDVHAGTKGITSALESEMTPSALLKAGVETAMNRDSFTGNRVYDPNAPLGTEARQAGVHLVRSAVGPVAQYKRYSHEPEGGKKFLWSQVGVTFPKTETESKSVILMHNLMREGMPPLNPDQQTELDARRERIQSGKMTVREAKNEIRKQTLSELQYYLPHLSYSDIKRVYAAATPEEQAIIRPIMQKKQISLVRNQPYSDEARTALADLQGANR